MMTKVEWILYPEQVKNKIETHVINKQTQNNISTINNKGKMMSINDYKTFLATLSWDEFQTYKSNVKLENLNDDQQQALKEESARRANAFNNFMSF
jgi:hypothetical protein